MATPNHTGTSHSLFILLGIPGLENQHSWISLPFFISYLVAVLGNCLLVFLSITECSLHEPMYFFLCMLALADLILSTTTVPKALAIFWFHAGEISLDGCVTQIFFIHATFIAESGILLAMAFDRYVAIRDPLCYTTVLSHAVIIRIGLAMVLRSLSVILPDVFLVKRLPFGRSNVLPHVYVSIWLLPYLPALAFVSMLVWLCVLLSTVVTGVLLILVSYMCILSAVFRLPSQGARQKALGTSGSHLGVISMFFLPGIFTIITQQFGHHVPLHTHILLTNVCTSAPPMLNPIIYGIKTRQIRECVVSTLSSQGRHC